jgi:hypothetical protein
MAQRDYMTIEELAKDITEKLVIIQSKESELAEVRLQIAVLEQQQINLMEKKRTLEQAIASEKYIITDKIGKISQ